LKDGTEYWDILCDRYFHLELTKVTDRCVLSQSECKTKANNYNCFNPIVAQNCFGQNPITEKESVRYYIHQFCTPLGFLIKALLDDNPRKAAALCNELKYKLQNILHENMFNNLILGDGFFRSCSIRYIIPDDKFPFALMLPDYKYEVDGKNKRFQDFVNFKPLEKPFDIMLCLLLKPYCDSTMIRQMEQGEWDQVRFDALAGTIRVRMLNKTNDNVKHAYKKNLTIDELAKFLNYSVSAAREKLKNDPQWKKYIERENEKKPFRYKILSGKIDTLRQKDKQTK